jgi:hypothetical protein
MLQNNRYEVSDGVQGGQLYTDGVSTNASVAGNIINGNYWPTNPQGPFPPLATGCAWKATSVFNAGVESYGFGHRFFNNEIEQNLGAGMQFAGSVPTGQITISSANPWYSSDSPRFIEANGAGGIGFLGPITNSGYIYPAQGVTLDDVLLRNNAQEDVYLDSVSNSSAYNYFINGIYNGFVNNSCLLSSPPIKSYTASSNPLTNSTPGTQSSAYSTYRGGACPIPNWTSQTPPPSHIPGWSW